MHISQLIEAIRVIGGELCLEELHQARMLHALGALGAGRGVLANWLLGHSLHTHPAIQPLLVHNSISADQVYALRLVYDADSLRVRSYTAYTKRHVEHLCPIALTEGFEYEYKYLDRAYFDSYAHILRPDTLPIYYREGGELSDTNYTNIILDIEGRLYTPERPLLAGVQRQHLLEQGCIEPAYLTLSDLTSAKHIYLINALMTLDNCITLLPSQIL